MTKVLFILSAVIILVSAFFAYQNGREFTRVRTAVAVVNMQVQTALNDVNKIVTEVNGVIANVATVQGELDIEGEKVKSQKLKLAQVENDLKRDQDQLDVSSKKLADLRVRLGKLPQGMKPETMVEEINGMKKATAEFQAQVELKKKEAEAEMGDARKAYEEIVRKIEDRKKSFDRNSLVARIVAVNTAWGFVVVDAGQSGGITEATKLLVTRGNQTVGKLSILSVQDNRTVANILPETLANGMSIAPGDRVILENLHQ
jgi:cell shape-determining protein MreC